MFAALLLAALTPAASAAEAPVCNIEHARYSFRADPSITARFHGVEMVDVWTNGVAMEMHFGKSGRSYWWLPFIGGTSDNPGFGWTALKGSPEAAPGYRYNLGDLLYFPFDDDYAMPGGETAIRGHRAPAHFFLYNMREAFWYRTDGEKRETAGRSLFDLVGCEADAPGASQPDLIFPHVP